MLYPEIANITVITTNVRILLLKIWHKNSNYAQASPNVRGKHSTFQLHTHSNPVYRHVMTFAEK